MLHPSVSTIETHQVTEHSDWSKLQMILIYCLLKVITASEVLTASIYPH